MSRYTLLLFLLLPLICYSQNTGIRLPNGYQKLKLSYPNFIESFDGKHIILKDGSKIVYDDGKKDKSKQELLNEPALSDLFKQPYNKGEISIPDKNYDPGRYRNEDFLKAMYGATAKDVSENLTVIMWCPKLVGIKLKITSINGVDKQLQKISDELDKLPHLKKYLTGATTYNWRTISGTNRLSSHSFGTAIDLNVQYSNYWQWDCKCKDENTDLKYKNQIPQEIVDIFEKYGFIWGGRWYHYDTMHFEYRPELLR
jgi:hypothetical protein